MSRRWHVIHPVTRIAFFLLGSLFLAPLLATAMNRQSGLDGRTASYSIVFGALVAMAYTIAITGTLPTSLINGNWLVRLFASFNRYSCGAFVLYLYLVLAALIYSIKGDTNDGRSLCFLCFLIIAPSWHTPVRGAFRSLDAIYRMVRLLSAVGGILLICFSFLGQPAASTAAFTILPIFILAYTLRWIVLSAIFSQIDRSKSSNGKEESHSSEIDNDSLSRPVKIAEQGNAGGADVV